MRNAFWLLLLLGSFHLSSAQAQELNWSEASRTEALANAKLMQDEDVSHIANRSTLTGLPTQTLTPEKTYQHRELITCQWKPRPLTNFGATYKFFCTDLATGKSLKVKIPPNTEAHTAIAMSRLFWLMGFPTDHSYSVRVKCLGCPENPFTGVGEVADRLYEFGSVEVKYPGEEIASRPEQGWSFKELEKTDAESALELLMAIIGNVDNGAKNQRLSCDPGHVYLDEQKQKHCSAATFVLHDLGFSLGHSVGINKHHGNQKWSKLNFNDWSHMKLWKKKRKCVANLPEWMESSLINPKITEGGRQYLAERIEAVSKQQLIDLFEAAQVQDFDPSHTPQEWADVLEQKFDEVLDTSCPE